MSKVFNLETLRDICGNAVVEDAGAGEAPVGSLTAEGQVALLNFLLSNNPEYDVLDLSGIGLNEKTLRTVTEGLKGNGFITQLKLDNLTQSAYQLIKLAIQKFNPFIRQIEKGEIVQEASSGGAIGRRKPRGGDDGLRPRTFVSADEELLARNQKLDFTAVRTNLFGDAINLRAVIRAAWQMIENPGDNKDQLHLILRGILCLFGAFLQRIERQAQTEHRKITSQERTNALSVLALMDEWIKFCRTNLARREEFNQAEILQLINQIVTQVYQIREHSEVFDIVHLIRLAQTQDLGELETLMPGIGRHLAEKSAAPLSPIELLGTMRERLENWLRENHADMSILDLTVVNHQTILPILARALPDNHTVKQLGLSPAIQEVKETFVRDFYPLLRQRNITLIHINIGKQDAVQTMRIHSAPMDYRGVMMPVEERLFSALPDIVQATQDKGKIATSAAVVSQQREIKRLKTGCRLNTANFIARSLNLPTNDIHDGQVMFILLALIENRKEAVYGDLEEVDNKITRVRATLKGIDSGKFSQTEFHNLVSTIGRLRISGEVLAGFLVHIFLMRSCDYVRTKRKNPFMRTLDEMLCQFEVFKSEESKWYDCPNILDLQSICDRLKVQVQQKRPQSTAAHLLMHYYRFVKTHERFQIAVGALNRSFLEFGLGSSKPWIYNLVSEKSGAAAGADGAAAALPEEVVPIQTGVNTAWHQLQMQQGLDQALALCRSNQTVREKVLAVIIERLRVILARLSKGNSNCSHLNDRAIVAAYATVSDEYMVEDADTVKIAHDVLARNLQLQNILRAMTGHIDTWNIDQFRQALVSIDSKFFTTEDAQQDAWLKLMLYERILARLQTRLIDLHTEIQNRILSEEETAFVTTLSQESWQLIQAQVKHLKIQAAVGDARNGVLQSLTRAMGDCTYLLSYVQTSQQVFLLDMMTCLTNYLDVKKGEFFSSLDIGSCQIIYYLMRAAEQRARKLTLGDLNVATVIGKLSACSYRTKFNEMQDLAGSDLDISGDALLGLLIHLYCVARERKLDFHASLGQFLEQRGLLEKGMIIQQLRQDALQPEPPTPMAKLLRAFYVFNQGNNFATKVQRLLPRMTDAWVLNVPDLGGSAAAAVAEDGVEDSIAEVLASWRYPSGLNPPAREASEEDQVSDGRLSVSELRTPERSAVVGVGMGDAGGMRMLLATAAAGVGMFASPPPLRRSRTYTDSFSGGNVVRRSASMLSALQEQGGRARAATNGSELLSYGMIEVLEQRLKMRDVKNGVTTLLTSLSGLSEDGSVQSQFSLKPIDDVFDFCHRDGSQEDASMTACCIGTMRKLREQQNALCRRIQAIQLNDPGQFVANMKQLNEEMVRVLHDRGESLLDGSGFGEMTGGLAGELDEKISLDQMITEALESADKEDENGHLVAQIRQQLMEQAELLKEQFIYVMDQIAAREWRQRVIDPLHPSVELVLDARRADLSDAVAMIERKLSTDQVIGCIRFKLACCTEVEASDEKVRQAGRRQNVLMIHYLKRLYDFVKKNNLSVTRFIIETPFKSFVFEKGKLMVVPYGIHVHATEIGCGNEQFLRESYFQRYAAAPRAAGVLPCDAEELARQVSECLVLNADYKNDLARILELFRQGRYYIQRVIEAAANFYEKYICSKILYWRVYRLFDHVLEKGTEEIWQNAAHNAKFFDSLYGVLNNYFLEIKRSWRETPKETYQALLRIIQWMKAIVRRWESELFTDGGRIFDPNAAGSLIIKLNQLEQAINQLLLPQARLNDEPNLPENYECLFVRLLFQECLAIELQDRKYPNNGTRESLSPFAKALSPLMQKFLKINFDLDTHRRLWHAYFQRGEFLTHIQQLWASQISQPAFLERCWDGLVAYCDTNPGKKVRCQRYTAAIRVMHKIRKIICMQVNLIPREDDRRVYDQWQRLSTHTKKTWDDLCASRRKERTLFSSTIDTIFFDVAKNFNMNFQSLDIQDLPEYYVEDLVLCLCDQRANTKVSQQTKGGALGGGSSGKSGLEKVFDQWLWQLGILDTEDTMWDAYFTEHLLQLREAADISPAPTLVEMPRSPGGASALGVPGLGMRASRSGSGGT